MESLSLAGETADEVPVTVWSPADLADDEPAPLLLVHDGAEYDQLARITTYCARPRRRRAAAAAPGRAGPAPSSATRGTPGRRSTCAPSPRPAWTGWGSGTRCAGPSSWSGPASAGLTALLLGLLAAPRVGGVYAQSGSFFQVRHDDSESGYRYFGRISRLVQTVLDMRHAEHPLVVGMSCGALEENVANNRDMAAALRRAGHDVTLREVPDLHNYTAWRDALDPGLTDVLRRVWGVVAAASWLRGRMPTGRVGSHGDHQRAPAGAGPRRRPRGGPPRVVGPAGAALPVRGRLGPRRRAQRHARRRAAPRRRRPGEPVLRRLARRVVVVRRRHPHRGARPAGPDLHRLAVRDGAALAARPGGWRAGGHHGRCLARRLPRRAPDPATRRRRPAGHRAVRQLRPVDVERVGRARRRHLLRQPHGLPREHGG